MSVVIIVGAPSVDDTETFSMDVVAAVGGTVTVVIGGAMVVVVGGIVVDVVVVLIGSVTLIRHPRFRWEAHCMYIIVCVMQLHYS